MAKRKSNRTRAKRHAQKVKLHELKPSFLREAKVDPRLPVFVCGTTASIDPANPEGLSRLVREAIRDAHTHLGVRAAHGVGDNTTVIVQTANGWVVRNRHGDVDHATIFPRLAALDERAQSKARTRERRTEFDGQTLNALLKNKALRQERERCSRAIFEAEMQLHTRENI